MTEVDSTRFWDRFDKSGECWIWTGTRQGKGYGGLTLNGKVTTAHRVAFELSRGRRLLPGESVLHHCDNPPCGRPDHLFVGTQADNMRDMVQKGRECKVKALGERNTNAKLTEAGVKDIRQRHGGGVTLSALAREYGVSVQVVSAVVARRAWRHVS